MTRALLATLLLAAALSDASAQTLAARIAAAGDGPVLFHFAPRPGVCGDGRGTIRIGRSMWMGNGFAGGIDARECEPGPVTVRATLSGGAVDRIESWVGRVREREGRVLGEVPAAEAARWLLGVAARSRGSVPEKAITPAMLADAPPDWRALLAIARGDDRGRSARTGAAFWLSRLAAAATLGHPGDIAAADREENETDEQDLKGHAVFVLSQRPRHEGIPALIHVAQTNPDAGVRAKAMFWLGQTGDSRVLDLFERILSEARR